MLTPDIQLDLDAAGLPIRVLGDFHPTYLSRARSVSYILLRRVCPGPDARSAVFVPSQSRYSFIDSDSSVVFHSLLFFVSGVDLMSFAICLELGIAESDPRARAGSASSPRRRVGLPSRAHSNNHHPAAPLHSVTPPGFIR